jgi:D-serine deaminase-like pyridoxal phosphate-dependent protein
MDFNLATMARFFEDRSAKLRPHFKTHKCPILAQKQVELGAIGLTCAKLGEAEVLVQAGIPSILIANQVIDPVKITRLAELSLKSQIIVAVDNPDNVHMYSAAAQQAGSVINLVVEVNIGLNRCGVQPGEAVLSLARLISQSSSLHFAGLLGYEGQTMFVTNPELRQKNVHQAMSELVRTADLLRRVRIAVDMVSAGGTGTYDLTGAYPGVTEVEAGSYLFMDAKYQKLGLPFRCALTLLANVISVPVPGRAVIDAGMKSLTTENGLPEVVSPPGVRLKALHEEHGILEVDPQTHLQIGDSVELLPSHVCTTVNLHDQYYALRNGQLEAIWPITARGKSQ